MIDVLLPPTSSPAGTQYYLMLFQLTLFLSPLVVRPGQLDALLQAWLVQWALPALLCVLIMLFDTSMALVHWHAAAAAVAEGGGGGGGSGKLEQARHQRNLYLTLLNLVLMIGITQLFRLHHAAAIYEERLRAASALLVGAQQEREAEEAHERVALARIASTSSEADSMLRVELESALEEQERLRRELQVVALRQTEEAVAGAPAPAPAPAAPHRGEKEAQVKQRRAAAPASGEAGPAVVSMSASLSVSDTDSDDSDGGATPRAFGVFSVGKKQPAAQPLVPEQVAAAAAPEEGVPPPPAAAAAVGAAPLTAKRLPRADAAAGGGQAAAAEGESLSRSGSGSSAVQMMQARKRPGDATAQAAPALPAASSPPARELRLEFSSTTTAGSESAGGGDISMFSGGRGVR